MPVVVDRVRKFVAFVFGLLPAGVRNRFAIEAGLLAKARVDPAGQKLFLAEYPVILDIRPPTTAVAQLLESGMGPAEACLERFAVFSSNLDDIAVLAANTVDPSWTNDYLPPLDGAALYCFIADERPATYLEIGSGNSTRFVARAIRDHGLRTRVISIDPAPRAEIDDLCDELVRSPLELADPAVFEQLQPGDHVFFDGSHRAFQNSDVVVFFTEILPALPSDILVGVHDIFLPDDYPAGYVERFYSEQYVLAAYLLGGAGRVRVELPLYAVSGKSELYGSIDALRGSGWDDVTRSRAWPWEDQHRPRGAGFWFRT